MAFTTKINFVHHLLHARDWQYRPEFDKLCKWWKDTHAGVCALVGIGGAGKTAIAERFLREIPDVLPNDPKISKNAKLPTPERLFVFSFYDAPNADNFIAHLAAWLSGTVYDESNPIPSFYQTLDLLQQAGSCLLVLDGLEKVQHDGARGGILGQIQDKRLSDLVLRLSRGYLPNIQSIITTRFPLAELEEEQPHHYNTISVENISDETGVDLLRQRGVKGTDVELRGIVKECGNHALTVDLTGGYISRFGGKEGFELKASEEIEKEISKEPNPARRRLLRQEYKFARVAERYRVAFKKSDIAALSLLERVCLFRLGIDVDTLASIFIGKDKEDISGKALARLSKNNLQAKLDILVDMRLLEANKTDSKFKYTIHPAVRDGFLKGLDKDTAKSGHEAARKGLEASLGKQPEEYPSDPASLDLLEEIVYHTLEAGHAQEAFDVYWDRIGGYENLGTRLGAYERGERICRAFAGNQPPDSAPLPKGLSENDQSIWINVWALYLSELGRIDAAAQCLKRNIKLRMSQERWKNSSISNFNLAGLLLRTGRLKDGLLKSEEALRLAELGTNAAERMHSSAYLGFAHALKGNIDDSQNDFRDCLHWQHKADGRIDNPLYSTRGILRALLLVNIGLIKDATEITSSNIDLLVKFGGDLHQDIPKCNLILADIARNKGSYKEARRFYGQAHEWAIARDAKELLCWAALAQAKIAYDEAKQKKNITKGKRAKLLEEAYSSIEEGLNIARDCGFGIFHIDLLLIRAAICLFEGKADEAEKVINIALFEGIHPKKESGRPVLLAATDDECGYAWGITLGLHLLAETRLLQTAQAIGNKTFVPALFDELPPYAQILIDEAIEYMDQCIEYRIKIQDPKVKETEAVFDKLNNGILTTYPLKPIVRKQGKAADTAPTSTEESALFDVFLSHNSKDKPAIRKLGEMLKEKGIKVWLDEWELAPGRLWQEKVEKIIKTAKSAAIVVGSDGIGPWENVEMRGSLTEFVKRKIPVIPVLLPGAPEESDLPLFLNEFTRVDLRDGITDEGINRIIWGITGKKPKS
ncbi:MAG: toll/interleukin-1 receptor domain-containing protein [candidate division Zixibacteria bacterium]|nr:toll/interleukin-1 receptor domain-containing protein [candidate division Zixibacteria bacterium]